MDMVIKLFDIFMVIMSLSLLFLFPIIIIDVVYVAPIASQKANEYCKTLGFDFYESYERIGIWSKEPLAIKCKYVEQYRQIDINRPLIEIKEMSS